MDRLWRETFRVQPGSVRVWGYALEIIPGKPPLLSEQAALLEAEAKRRFPDAQWCGCIEEVLDPLKSRRPYLPNRKGGLQLKRLMKAGDHLLATTISVIAESFAALNNSLWFFHRHKLHLHFLDLDEVAAACADPLEVVRFALSNQRKACMTKLQHKWTLKRQAQLAKGYFPRGQRPPFGCNAEIVHPIVMDKANRPRLKLVADPEQMEILKRIVSFYEDSHFTFQHIADHLGFTWHCPNSPLKKSSFTQRDVVYLYEMAKHYERHAHLDVRVLNPNLFPKYNTTLLGWWKPPEGVVLTAAQNIEWAEWHVRRARIGSFKRKPQEETYQWRKNREVCAKGLTTKAAREARHRELAAQEEQERQAAQST